MELITTHLLPLDPCHVRLGDVGDGEVRIGVDDEEEEEEEEGGDEEKGLEEKVDAGELVGDLK